MQKIINEIIFIKRNGNILNKKSENSQNNKIIDKKINNKNKK